MKFTSELAKFSDLERHDFKDGNSFGELPVSDEFNSNGSGNITMPSRMDDDFENDEDAPF